MKKMLLLLLVSIAVYSCKNSEEKNVETTETAAPEVTDARAYKGDFLSTDDAMVLMGPNFIYGVKRDLLSEGLAKQVAAIKQNDYDMVGVIVKGVVSKNTDTDSQWEEMITIKEIMRVADKPSEVDIKLNETEKKN
jgi:hypothetical protein